MRFDELFEMRKLTGTKLKNYIRSNGFSKVSFCMKTEISRTTLDKILNGEIDNKSTCNKDLNKILIRCNGTSGNRCRPPDKWQKDKIQNQVLLFCTYLCKSDSLFLRGFSSGCPCPSFL